ncbi:aa3-type cytochrome c oxidase subunit IV [Maricaulis sp.]|jgi:hypothetical protein|uniref:aa3-type cytochrome c oxidase subunit IV n=1 Tax=Maricaulis sp. TaxID=1486257 RepID=UPI002626A048|nr:aa3-type cytochrome c oxidase subunit IV [Maricaulis sp.]
MAADHVRGEMDIAQHKSTFDGFISVSVWSSLLTGVTVLYLTLVFAAGFNWMASLIAVALVGILAGLALRMKMSWYVTVAGLFVFGLISGGIAQLFSIALAG